MGIFTLDKSAPRTRLKPFALMIMLSAVLVCAAYPGSGLSLPLAMAVLILTVGVAVIFTRSIFCMLLISIPVSLIWTYAGGSFELAALLCSPITVIGVGAFLIKTTRSPYLIGIVPAAYLMALLIGGRPIAALLSLIFFPIAYLLARGFTKKLGRMAQVCRISVALAVIGAAVLLIWLILKNGYFSPSLISESVDALLQRMIEFFTAQYAETAKLYADRGIDISLLALSPADARLYAVMLFGIVPALAVIVLNAVAFISHQLTVSLLGRSGQHDCLTAEVLSFSMSWISAIVFIIAYFVMLIANLSGNENVTLIAENLYLILLPGLALTGVLIAIGRGSDKRRHTFRIILMLGLMFISPNLALAFTAFSGCTDIFRSALERRRPEDL